MAPKVGRAHSAEKFREGRAATPENFAEAGRRAVDDVRPISDMRASAEYRKDLVAVLAKRTLEGACALARAAKQKGVRK